MEAKRENHFIKKLKPKCNVACLSYSLILGTGIFLTTFFLTKDFSKKIPENYEFQIKPNELPQISIQDYIQRFESNLSSLIQIEKRTVRPFLQYSYKPDKSKYKMKDAFIKYRIWNNGDNDLTLKTKDLFKENIDSVKIDIDKKYDDVKHKIEENIYWENINNNIEIGFSWQQSAKINNLDEFPQLDNLKDAENYFPNSNEIFLLKDDDKFTNYNKKNVNMIEYKSTINNQKIDFDLLIEYNERNNLKSISFEYKVGKPISFDDGKFFNKLNKKITKFI